LWDDIVKEIVVTLTVALLEKCEEDILDIFIGKK
jgi:hypothetical protein